MATRAQRAAWMKLRREAENAPQKIEVQDGEYAEQAHRGHYDLEKCIMQEWADTYWAWISGKLQEKPPIPAELMKDIVRFIKTHRSLTAKEIEKMEKRVDHEKI